jgi:hypothetical protein
MHSANHNIGMTVSWRMCGAADRQAACTCDVADGRSTSVSRHRYRRVLVEAWKLGSCVRKLQQSSIYLFSTPNTRQSPGNRLRRSQCLSRRASVPANATTSSHCCLRYGYLIAPCCNETSADIVNSTAMTPHYSGRSTRSSTRTRC